MDRSFRHLLEYSCDYIDEKQIKTSRFYYHADSGQCDKFPFKPFQNFDDMGCYENQNNFKSLQECEDVCKVK